MNINMVNTCVIDKIIQIKLLIVHFNPLLVDLSFEGGQAHGHELQEVPHCGYHGYIKRRK